MWYYYALLMLFSNFCVDFLKILLSSIRQLRISSILNETMFKVSLIAFLQNPVLATSGTHMLKIFSQSSSMVPKLPFEISV